ncbi:MAG TPA: SDR family NAD(P)-dependent oxidoreductase [Gemmatimonadales bacterium]|nr:SDR family NAD(P)-dependent oxidoreductase [Gemmatimonadales bacterium]
MTRNRLGGKVVVLTGASSGLGRAAAVEFARRGARVVLAARNVAELEQVAARCRRVGGAALAVETDVTDEAAVRRLAAKTLELAGRIDVWVNNAGVTAFAPLLEGPFEEHRAVIETNVYGSIFGARAVLPIFRRQRAGVLINVSSVLGKVGQPYVPSYVISKFAIQGLSETLRKALAEEPEIHVCTLLPYAIDTPHFEHGANRVGLDARAMAPMQTPEAVARALVSLAERPKRERYVPRAAALAVALHALLPSLGDRMVLLLTREWHFGHTPQPATSGNLFRPAPRGEVRGHRPQRASLPRMLLWVVGQLARSPRPRRRRRSDLRPHAAS